jgi:Ca-activated chloride channel homolog
MITRSVESPTLRGTAEFAKTLSDMILRCWQPIWKEEWRMRRAAQITVAAIIMALTEWYPAFGQTQTPPPPPVATFRSSIDLVRVNAVVRDRKGRFVPGLAVQDFELLENGRPRTIADFGREDAGVSIALLFDVSGSMEARMTAAREAATHLLNWLQPDRDEEAVFTFDTQLNEVRPFTAGLLTLPQQLEAVRPFGATSLHDAIAQTARRVGTRDSLRRAVVVFTDGRDTASRMSASEVSGIASAIDVPIYIVGIVPSIDNPAADVSTTSVERSALTGSLSNLAYWTGGETFVVSTIAERSMTARRIVDELRHQYLIAFEASGVPGWHPLVIRMRDKDLTVRARSGYIAGQSRPISH